MSLRPSTGGSSPARPAGTRGARGIALLLAALALGAAKPAPIDAERLARENEQLERLVKLAESDAFYLVLDPRAARLKLMLRGAVLQDFAVLHVAVGSRRVAFATRAAPEHWPWRVWSGSELDPPRELDRFELKVAPGVAEDEVPEAPLPPTPEERFPALERYRIHFDEGLALEVRIAGTDENAPGFWGGLKTALRARFADLAISVGLRDERDALRIRVDLAREDAASLYRSLPPETRFVILTAPSAP